MVAGAGIVDGGTTGRPPPPAAMASCSGVSLRGRLTTLSPTRIARFTIVSDAPPLCESMDTEGALPRACDTAPLARKLFSRS